MFAGILLVVLAAFFLMLGFPLLALITLVIAVLAVLAEG